MTSRIQRSLRTFRIHRGLLLLSVVAALGLAAFAEPRASLKPTGYVNDFAGVLSADTRSQVEAYCYQVEQKTQAQIALVTVKSLDGEDVEGYTNSLFRQWGVGDKKEKRGVLILFATEDRKYRVEVGYGLEPILPDGKVGGFGREAVPYLKQNDYDSAVRLLVGRVGSVITAGDDGTATEDAAPVPQHYRQSKPINPVLLIIGAIIFLIMICTRTGRAILFWWLLTGGGRGGGGGWGGGSFGGGGGGGFSGFGGGDSGGGGASGSW